MVKMKVMEVYEEIVMKMTTVCMSLLASCNCKCIVQILISFHGILPMEVFSNWGMELNRT